MPAVVEKRPKIKITKDLVGRFVRVYYKGNGCTDGLCVDIDVSSKIKTFSAFFGDNVISTHLEANQLIAVGPWVEFPEF